MSTRKLGQIVRGKREGKRLTIAKTAELCELSDRGLLLIELGDVDPKLSSLLKIAAVLEIYLGDIEGCKQTDPSEELAGHTGGS